MSAKPFWILLAICTIVVVELVIAKPIINWGIRVELASRDYLRVVQVLPEFQGSPDQLLTPELVQAMKPADRLKAMLQVDRLRVFSLAGVVLILGLVGGLILASIVFRHLVTFGDRLSSLSTVDKLLLIVGLLIGVTLSALILPKLLELLPGGQDPVFVFLLGVIVTYLSIVSMMSMKTEIGMYWPAIGKGRDQEKVYQKPKILDTNVIIDGRVADVCATGFLEGQICIPSFILEELQHIADSGDSLKRARGRRGLEILYQMQKELDLTVKQYDAVDPTNPDEIDARLIKLAQDMDGAIVTNDFNLNKVAGLQGVPVLNVNQLANALKPIVLPGEDMTVTIIKEGKEPNQGIAYLDDGTMVVVESAKKNINETVEVVVTSVLQTVAGKMIFANLKALQAIEDELIDRNLRSYSGFRARKKTR